MEEIKIYHPLGRTLILILSNVVIMAGCIFALQYSKANWNTFEIILLWILITFFALLSLCLICTNLRACLTGKPLLTITDTSCTINQGIKHTVINFADVESFGVAKKSNQEFVTVHYKPAVEIQKMENAGFFSRINRKMNKRLVNAQEAFSSSGTNLRTMDLYYLLDERLKQFQNNSK